MIFPMRHRTLAMSFQNPSQAMEQWVMVDMFWHDAFEYVGSAGVPLDEATSSADLDAAQHHQKGETK